MIVEEIHGRLVSAGERVNDWFHSKSRGLPFPIYSSFDIRDAHFKLGPVDANIFPAGFNNICEVDREQSVDVAKDFLDNHYSAQTKNIVLLTEEHTNNPYYWDNVLTLQTILEGAERNVRLAFPKALPEPLRIQAASGRTAVVHSGSDLGSPDLIISNNDFSNEHEEWSRSVTAPMNPPRELGWYRRRKDRFFKVYNELAGEFSKLIDIDPWTIQVETEVFHDFDVEDEASRDRLSEAAQRVWDRIRAKYKERGIDREPFLFVKNNAGTYGLGVIQVKSPQEIRQWNYKSRKKMKAAKGGREVTEVIIQEGVPTTTQGQGGQTAEPVIYMIGCQLAGGFLRVHGEKSDQDSLNSPGAVFQKLCVTDLRVKLEGCPMENTYGWLARLAFLSVAHEARELGVEFKGYRFAGPCS